MGANPFKAALHAGVQTYYCTAEDRIRLVAWFDRAQCEAALKLPDLQKTVAAAVLATYSTDKPAVRVVKEEAGYPMPLMRWTQDGGWRKA
ncbi:MAG TPA: hypothetical protein PLE22_01440 [Acidovorax sp.]|jgi:hypothetical protein|nr:hypothetical protein [Acidovorax sp.]